MGGGQWQPLRNAKGSERRRCPWREQLRLVNAALKSEYKTISNGQGFYSFPTLPVGHYDLTIEATGFRTQKKTNLTVDTDAALKLDAVLEVGQQSETVTVAATERPRRRKWIPWRLTWANS